MNAKEIFDKTKNSATNVLELRTNEIKFFILSKIMKASSYGSVITEVNLSDFEGSSIINAITELKKEGFEVDWNSGFLKINWDVKTIEDAPKKSFLKSLLGR